MKQSRVIQHNRRNLQSVLEKLPKQGCEYLEKTIKEILKQGERPTQILGQTLSLN